MHSSSDISPLGVIENLAAQIIESSTLLELIAATINNEDNANNAAIACLIRSLAKTADFANEHAFRLASLNSLSALQKSCAASTTSSAPAPIGPFYYPEPTTLGDRIRTLREECELSRTYLADIINVPCSLMWKWEDDEICPSDEQLARLAKEFGCDLHWLLTGDGRPVPAENNQAEPTCKSETLGDRIKSMRELRNLGQFYLASSIGVTRSCIEAWEEDTTIPASDKIIPLANALNCDPMWLLTGEDGDAQPADA